MLLFKDKTQCEKFCANTQFEGKLTEKGFYHIHTQTLRIYRQGTLAFYVFNLSSVGPEIEVAPGLSRVLYYCSLYFPLHSVLQTALSDVRMQPPGIHWAHVCLVFLQG